MSRPLRAGDLIVCLVAVAAMIAIAAASALLAPVQSVGERASTYSSRKDGAKAAFLLLKQIGYDVERSLDAVAHVGAPPEETILIIASPLKPATAQDRREIRRFIEAGGIVLATGMGRDYLPELKPRHRARDIAAVKPEAYRAATAEAGAERDANTSTTAEVERDETIAMTHGAPQIRLASEVDDDDHRHDAANDKKNDGAAQKGDGNRRTPDAPGAHSRASGSVAVRAATSAYRAVYTRGASADAGVLVARFGSGRAIWWSGSTPFLNNEIQQPGHVELLLNTLGAPGERVVLWDEFGHGYQRSFASYLAGTPLPAAFAQLALMAGLAVFTFSRRRGPIHHVVRETRASPLEFVEAMAALYQKAAATRGAIETGRAHLRRLLMGASRMPANSTDAQLAVSAAARYPIDASAVQRLLADSAAAAESDTLSPGRALSLMQKLQETAAAIVDGPARSHAASAGKATRAANASRATAAADRRAAESRSGRTH